MKRPCGWGKGKESDRAHLVFGWEAGNVTIQCIQVVVLLKKGNGVFMRIQSISSYLAIGLSLSWAVTAQAQWDITAPGDPIEVVNGMNDGDASTGAPPAKEGVENVIDNMGQKYVNFLDVGSGFAVTPARNWCYLVVTGLRFYTANDAPESDPASYEIFGSNEGLLGPWTLISAGPLNLPAERNPGGGEAPVHGESVTFPNQHFYSHFKVVFPSLKNAAAANGMQIAEVELLAVPEPTSAALGTLGLLAVGALGRRKC